MTGFEKSQGNAEQRVYYRIPTTIPGKISISALGTVQDCVVTDLSAGGAGLHYHSAAPPSELVCLLTVSEFGSFEGITVRDVGNMRGIRFLFGEAERQHLQENLVAFVKSGLSGVSDLRMREKDQAKSKLSFSRTNGEAYECEVTAISLQGVALQTRIRPPLGELVKLARVYGRVVRHDPDGIGVQFVNFVGGLEAASVTMSGAAPAP